LEIIIIIIIGLKTHIIVVFDKSLPEFFFFLTPSYKIRFVWMKFIFGCNELHLTNVGHIADYCVWTEPTQKFWEVPELNSARYLKNVIYHVYHKIVFSFLRFIKRYIYTYLLEFFVRTRLYKLLLDNKWFNLKLIRKRKKY